MIRNACTDSILYPQHIALWLESACTTRGDPNHSVECTYARTYSAVYLKTKTKSYQKALQHLCLLPSLASVANQVLHCLRTLDISSTYLSGRWSLPIVGLTVRSKKSDVGANIGVKGVFAWNIEHALTAIGWRGGRLKKESGDGTEGKGTEKRDRVIKTAN